MGNVASSRIRRLVPDVATWLPPRPEAVQHSPTIAIIVEPRIHVNLPLVTQQMATMYPNNHIYLVHGESNNTFVHTDPTLAGLVAAGAMTLVPLSVDNLNASMYNAMFSSIAFWDLFDADTALIFQTDSWLCDSNLELEDFSKYDYVGAPITHGAQNGGLSLRNIPKMREVLRKCRTGRPEDHYFSRGCAAAKVHTPSKRIAHSFALQRGAPRTGVAPFGTHKPWQHWGAAHVRDVIEPMCPGVTTIMENYT